MVAFGSQITLEIDMTFKEWLDSLTPSRSQSAGEDLADSIGLMIIMALVCMVVFI
jgi:hypothetical protein